jgi:hypothetical protein
MSVKSFGLDREDRCEAGIPKSAGWLLTFPTTPTVGGAISRAARKPRGYSRLSTIRTVIFLLAGKLDFSTLNPHVGDQPT